MQPGNLFKSFALPACAALLVLPATASAQARYSNKPIRFVVGFSAGGPTDVIARVLGRAMSESLAQPAFIENRAGADSPIATGIVAQAEPDGYTILIASGSHSFNASLYPTNKLDPVNDFAPISLIGDAANFLVVHPSVSARDVKESIALARKNPYKGSGSAIPALLTNEVQVSISSIVTLLQHVSTGGTRALAVTSAKRSSLAQDIPAVNEKGLPSYVASTWYGMLAPARTPPAIVQLLNTTLKKVLLDPAVKTQLLSQGLEPVTNTPEEFSRYILEDQIKWAKVVNDSGAKAAQ